MYPGAGPGMYPCSSVQCADCIVQNKASQCEREKKFNINGTVKKEWSEQHECVLEEVSSGIYSQQSQQGVRGSTTGLPFLPKQALVGRHLKNGLVFASDFQYFRAAM